MRTLVSAPMVMAAVRKHFAPPRWAVLEQVADTAGFANRRVDAIALSLWPSQGLEAVAIEVKVSRADWRRELRDPAKMDDVGRKCHRVWIAAPVGVVSVDEVPPTWGLLEVVDGAAKATRQAARLGDPEPSWAFIMAVLRRAAESVDARVADAVQAEQDRLRDLGIAALEPEIAARVADALAEQNRKIAFLEKDLKALLATKNAFEASSGLKLAAYNGPQLGAAVAAVLALGGADEALRFARVRAADLRSAADRVQRALEEVR